MKNFGYGYACLFIHLWESCIVVMRQYKHIHPTMSLVNFEDATVSHFVGLLVGWSVNQLVSWLVPCLLFPHFWAVFASLPLPNCMQLMMTCIWPCSVLFRVFPSSFSPPSFLSSSLFSHKLWAKMLVLILYIIGPSIHQSHVRAVLALPPLPNPMWLLLLRIQPCYHSFYLSICFVSISLFLSFFLSFQLLFSPPWSSPVIPPLLFLFPLCQEGPFFFIPF